MSTYKEYVASGGKQMLGEWLESEVRRMAATADRCIASRSSNDDLHTVQATAPEPTSTEAPFYGTVDGDSELQAVAREAGWALSELIDEIAWEKRGQVQGIVARLADALLAAEGSAP